MRIGARFAEQDQLEFALAAERPCRGGHDRTDVGRGHPRLDPRRGVAIGGDGDVGGDLHQRDFGRRLVHPAPAHHRRAIDDGRVRHRFF